LGLNRRRVQRPSRLYPPPGPVSTKGKDWLHEPKWDGFRIQVIKDGSDVRLYSKSGGEYSSKLPGMRKAFAELPDELGLLT
jgi:ATP-dependent DNA ligase